MGEWDVSFIDDMSNLFNGQSAFNADISKWEMGHVTDMASMFKGAKSFNTDISGWDVSHATDLSNMFREARAFDVDLSDWDVSKVVKMDFMFYEATSFSQTLCGKAWIESQASKTEMFAKSPGSICLTTTTTTSTPSTPTGIAANALTLPTATQTALVPVMSKVFRDANTGTMVGAGVMGVVAMIVLAI